MRMWCQGGRNITAIAETNESILLSRQELVQQENTLELPKINITMLRQRTAGMCSVLHIMTEKILRVRLRARRAGC